MRKQSSRAKTTTRKTKRRSTSSSGRSATKNTSQKKLQEMITPPWERVQQLGYSQPVIYDIPWEYRSIATLMHAKHIPGVGYVTDGVHEMGKQFIAKPYSWMFYVAQRATKESGTPHYLGNREDAYQLREDQQEDVASILDAYRKGAPEFLVANGTGTGKTVTTFAAAQQIAPKSLLIVCPSAVQAVWRQHIGDMGDREMRIVIINYESLKKLQQPPASAINSKKTSTQNKNIALHGNPYAEFEMIIFDEAHKLKNPTSQQSRIAAKLSDKASFVLRLSATPGKDPSQLHHLWRGLIWKTGDAFEVTDGADFQPYIDWCKRHNIGGIIHAPFGNGITWDGEDTDLRAMESILYGDDNGKLLGIRRIPEHWETATRQPIPIEMTPEDSRAYELVLQETKRAILDGLSKNTKDMSKGLAAMVALRQKTGIIKAQTITEYVKYALNDLQEQVVISTIFHNTTNTLSELLDRAGIEHTILTGEHTAEEKEQRRILFQQGKVPVIITSLTTGISLHSNESATQATSTPRRLVIADTHWSPIEHRQLEGRINRNGEHGVITIPFLQETIDEKVTQRLLSGMRNQSILQDSGEEDDLRFLASELGITI